MDLLASPQFVYVLHFFPLFILALSLPLLQSSETKVIHSPEKMDYINEVKDTYDWLWELRDTRVDHLPLMGGCLPVITIAVIYVYLVKVWGPRHMKEKAPYQLR